MTALRVPRVEQPDVTVVIVTLDAWEWTERALRALVANTPPCYEVVVVDNASSAETVEALRTVEGIELLCNDTNVGFGNACNQGVVRARARYLAFLNPDALVHDGWLAPLLAVLDAEPDVAAVAPRLLNLDGTLQESGALVFRDGLVLNYGDGDDPERPIYRFRRDVDYASAACLLVRRAAFLQVGGFDPVYSPAYLEDVDLCFALAAAGWRVSVVPDSTVTHARWASGDQSGTVRLVERNRPVFRARWAEALQRRTDLPEDRDPVRMIGARDLLATERLLVTAAGVPRPDGDIAERRLVQLVHALVDNWPRARVTLAAGEGSSTAASALMSRGVEVDPAVGDWRRWLDERRHHYGTVILVDGADDDVAEALRRSQPQALTVWCHSDATGDWPSVLSPPAVIFDGDDGVSDALASIPKVDLPATDADPHLWRKAVGDALVHVGMVPDASSLHSRHHGSG
jgi:O-antigen biosynthesis protein